ncbi:MAG: phosphodiester glycosidase family protein [Aristaeellaceae bacterium]
MKRFLRLLALACALSLLAAPGFASDYEPIPYDMEPAPYPPHQDCFLPDDAGYHDDSLDIRIETFRHLDTTVMAAYVTLTDASQMRTGTASPAAPLAKRLNTVAKMTKYYQGVLGINGDYFCYHSQGIVVRNGKTLRKNYVEGRDTLIIDEKGDFTILQPTTKAAYEAFEGEVIHAFCFGPGLVIDGEPLTDLETVRMDNGKYKLTQRMAICQLGPLSYLILTCEGPENENSVGMNLADWAALCKEMGAVNAYNLDGGSSATIALNDRKINALSSNKERPVGDLIYFCTLIP